jgi:hypothetical protein
MRSRKPRQVVVLGLLAMTAGGCGYTTDRPFPQQVHSVYVDLFQSKEFRRGIEMRLTEAVRKRIEMDADYVNTPRERADTLLTGEVLEYRQAAFVDDFRTGLPREIGGALIVSFRWKDQRTGKVLAENPRLVQQVEHVRTVGETDFTAIDLAVDGMARQIVQQMETTW